MSPEGVELVRYELVLVVTDTMLSPDIVVLQSWLGSRLTALQPVPSQSSLCGSVWRSSANICCSRSESLPGWEDLLAAVSVWVWLVLLLALVPGGRSVASDWRLSLSFLLR